jgi:signal transduction histidine kinase
VTAAVLNENRLREQELLYFGRVLAGQCHELVNALNVAHELCGLHEDILPSARESRAGAVEKLGSLARRIQTQVARCHAILRVLSRFAHSVDEPRMECDAREILERAVFLAARQARLRQTELQAVLPKGDVLVVECNPFRLQQAIHAGIEQLLEGIAEGGRITVSLTPDAAGAVVTLDGAVPLPCDDVAAGRLAQVTALVQAAGGEVRETPEGGGRLVFFIAYGRRDAALPDSDKPPPGASGGS